MNKGEERIRIHKATEGDEAVLFQREEKKREKKVSIVVILAVLLVIVYFVSVICLIEYNRNNYSLAWVLKYVRQNIEDFYDMLVGNMVHNSFQFTVYRYLIVALSGAALGASGALLKGVFRNSLASPSTLGVQSGGMLGNLVYVVFFSTVPEIGTAYKSSELHEQIAAMGFFERYAQQLLVLAGSFFGILLITGVMAVASEGKASSSQLVLAGMIFSTGISSLNDLIQHYILLEDPFDSRIELFRIFALGSFDRAFTLETFLMMAVVLVPCMVIVCLVSGKMNVFALGNEEASTLGLNVKRYRFIMIAIPTIMTAVVVAYCGQLGFVGYMIPQAARKIAGPDFKKLLPASIFLGGIIMILIFDVASFFLMASSINMFTSLIGGVMMVIVLLRKRGYSNAAVTR